MAVQVAGSFMMNDCQHLSICVYQSRPTLYMFAVMAWKADLSTSPGQGVPTKPFLADAKLGA